jgi:putative transposase
MWQRKPSSEDLECGGLPPLSSGTAAADATTPPQSGSKLPQSKAATDWPHAPVHRLTEAGAYMVTSGTYQKLHHFGTPERLSFLQDELLSLARQYAWELQAWVVFSNHYHFVAMAPADPTSLRPFVRHLHSVTARAINRVDGTEGRKVWFEYWDTHLTFERSYLARLNYVHQNPVHHGLVPVASAYPWCSARWFEWSATTAVHKTVTAFKIDRVNVRDEYKPVECGSLPRSGGTAAADPPPHPKAGASSRTPK